MTDPEIILAAKAAIPKEWELLEYRPADRLMFAWESEFYGLSIGHADWFNLKWITDPETGISVSDPRVARRLGRLLIEWAERQEAGR